MIDEIHVQNIALIRDAKIAPAAGMTAITGETGAGKTALLAACRLIMGQRADMGMIREGEDAAEVQGRLFLDASEASHAESDLDAFQEDSISKSDLTDEIEVVINRRLTRDGRSHVYINGQIASVSQLSDLVSPTIDLCSQHDHQMLIKPQQQRYFLDLWCGNKENGLLEAYRKSWKDALHAQQALDEVLAGQASSAAKLDEARLVLRRVDPVDPTQEDYDELMATLRKSENAELLARVTSKAHAALSDEGGALDYLNEALASIDEGVRADSLLNKNADALRDALFTVEDVAHEIAAYQSAIDLDVGELEMMQERASAYQQLMRTYGPTIQDVIDCANEARRTLHLVDDAEQVEKEARKALEEAERALQEAAHALSESRRFGAPKLAEEVTSVMSKLEMEGSALVCEVEQLPREQWNAEGPDGITFLFRPAEGMQCRPISRIASGGELSRVMLAFHVVMGERDSVPTLVFDEIDAGVGGSTALALGEVLAQLAATHQVIVVTHLAQVAAQADIQYVVRKNSSDGEARTTIEDVVEEARVEEIARMLSGSITPASLQHAKELLC